MLTVASGSYNQATFWLIQGSLMTDPLAVSAVLAGIQKRHFQVRSSV